MLNGVPAPKLPPALENRLKAMFAEIQEPFERHCPPNRKNFLSYGYTLYKFCELLGEDSYLAFFPLLKSVEKLYLQDQIWKVRPAAPPVPPTRRRRPPAAAPGPCFAEDLPRAALGVHSVGVTTATASA